MINDVIKADPLPPIKDTLRVYLNQLPPFFSNLLPEGYLRAYLTAKENVKLQQEFFLLMALGQDLPGAVRVEPTVAAGAERQASEPMAIKKPAFI